jgi:hypothetical protein
VLSSASFDSSARLRRPLHAKAVSPQHREEDRGPKRREGGPLTISALTTSSERRPCDLGAPEGRIPTGTRTGDAPNLLRTYGLTTCSMSFG